MRAAALCFAVLLTALPACDRVTSRDGPVPPGETPQEVIARQGREIEQLKADLAERDAQVKGIREQLDRALGLEAEFADAIVGVAKVVVGRFSHIADFDPNRPGPDGVKVYVYLEDRDGETIKQAGRITLKVYDLKGDRKLGHWVFNPREALKHWKGGFLLNCYVFQLPWQEDPGEIDKVQLHWQFDALDGRTFDGTGELTPSPRQTP